MIKPKMPSKTSIELLQQVAMQPNEEALQELCSRVFKHPDSEWRVLANGLFDAVMLQIGQEHTATYCGKIYFLAGMRAHLNGDEKAAFSHFKKADDYSCPQGTYWLARYLADDRESRVNQQNAIGLFKRIAKIIPDANYYLIYLYRQNPQLKGQAEELSLFSEELSNAASLEILEKVLGDIIGDSYKILLASQDPETRRTARFVYAQKAAATGSAFAMYHLGLCYLHGEGIAKDNQLAIQWLKKAAAEKHTAAMLLAGMLYEQGSAVTRDLAKAGQYYKETAEANAPAGMYHYSRFLYEGIGNIPKDVDAALYHCRRAADYNISEAQYLYACMQEERNYPENQVNSSYLAAAHNGNVEAMFKLGLRYRIAYTTKIQEKKSFNYSEEITHLANQAYTWLHASANKGCFESMYELCYLHQKQIRELNIKWAIFPHSWTTDAQFRCMALVVLQHATDVALIQKMLTLIQTVCDQMPKEQWLKEWDPQSILELESKRARFALSQLGLAHFRQLEYHYLQCDKLIARIAETNQVPLMRLIACLQPHVIEMTACSKDPKQKETAHILYKELQPWVYYSLALIKALQENNNGLLQAAKTTLKELLKPYSLFEQTTTKLSMLFKPEQKKLLLHRDSALLESLLVVAEIEIAATQSEPRNINK